MVVDKVDYQTTPLSPGKSRAFSILLLLSVLGVVSPITVADPYAEAAAIPHVGERARENYIQYLYAGQHKAFAIAPGGAWAWRSDAASPEQARQLALSSCQSNSQQKCVVYAENDQVVFDADTWPTLWGPYLNNKQAAQAATGNRVGQRLYDLSFKTNKGKPRSLSKLKGKLVFVHFWGSWCPPCMREFPSLLQLQQQLNTQLPGKVEMVLLQMREPYNVAREWAKQNDFSSLPLYDSGALSDETTTLSLKGGAKIADRRLAKAFPSSYVLDKNGIVIFSHYGPITNWQDYLPFFSHAAAASSK